MAAKWSTSQPQGTDLGRDLPDGVNIVDWMASPTGGFWLLGQDGGVFAVGGAPFMGSYTTLKGQDPNKKFSRIQSYTTPDGQTGYSLLSDTGQTYGTSGEFAPLPLPPKPTPKSIDPSAPAAVNTSAAASVKDTLAKFGLNLDQSTVDTLTNSFRTGGSAQLMLDLRGTKEYKTRFPAMEKLDAAGKHIDEGTYIGLEGTYKGTMNAYGIPSEFQTGLIDQFIGGQVSPDEVNSRIKDASTAAYSSPPEVRAALSSMYGLGSGDIISFFLDPQKSTNILQQRVLSGATTGAAAEKAGFGPLTKQEAESIGFERGVSPGAAAQGFGTLYQEGQLFDPQNSGEQAITREQQIAAQFGGSTPDQEAIANRAASRKATFGGGGGYAADQKGVSGLGTSNT